MPRAAPSWISPESWETYLAQRTKARAVNTDYALDLIIGKLDKHRQAGLDPQAILDNMIEFGWVGVYLPKTQDRGRPAAQSFRAQDRADAESRASQWTGRDRPQTDNVIEMEPAQRRLLK